MPYHTANIAGEGEEVILLLIIIIHSTDNQNFVVVSIGFSRVLYCIKQGSLLLISSAKSPPMDPEEIWIERIWILGRKLRTDMKSRPKGYMQFLSRIVRKKASLLLQIYILWIPVTQVGQTIICCTVLNVDITLLIVEIIKMVYCF